MSEALDAQRRGIRQEAAQDLNKHDFNALNIAQNLEGELQSQNSEISRITTTSSAATEGPRRC